MWVVFLYLNRKWCGYIEGDGGWGGGGGVGVGVRLSTSSNRWSSVFYFIILVVWQFNLLVSKLF